MDPIAFWSCVQAIGMWVQAVILAITLWFLGKYVRSTREIAEATREQLLTSQEPVVSFELRASQDGLSTNPTMVNHSRNHARCWIDLDIRVHGQRVEQGPAYDDTGPWTVQAGHTVNGHITTPGAGDGPVAFEELLQEQMANRASEVEQITATVTLRYRRFHSDGHDQERKIGPLRYYFGIRERKWIPIFPETP